MTSFKLTWVVKEKNWDQVIWLGDDISQEEAQAIADQANLEYQTDTYIVEEYDPTRRWFKS